MTPPDSSCRPSRPNARRPLRPVFNDRQNERSADDQLAACRALRRARGWTIVTELKDEAISGALMVNRPAVNAIMALADARAFDVLLTEDEDRVARNLEHQAHVYNRLDAAGAYWATLHTERVELMHVAFKGMAAQQFLVDLGHKTAPRHARQRRSAAWPPAPASTATPPSPAGRWPSLTAEAEIVREIFARYAAGESAQGIAADLNRRGVTGARGGAWTTAQIPARASAPTACCRRSNTPASRSGIG
jgi:site-specific DNA recombinase